MTGRTGVIFLDEKDVCNTCINNSVACSLQYFIKEILKDEPRKQIKLLVLECPFSKKEYNDSFPKTTPIH